MFQSGKTYYIASGHGGVYNLKFIKVATGGKAFLFMNECFEAILVGLDDTKMVHETQEKAIQAYFNRQPGLPHFYPKIVWSPRDF